MPQYSINTTPVTAGIINNAMYQPTFQTLSMNDRYSRLYTKTGFNTTISYGSFLNTPGFNLQSGLSVRWDIFSYPGVTLFVSNNFPGIQIGDPFSVVVGNTVSWGTASPVTHHGFIYGTPRNITLTNGTGGKRWHSTSSYDGGNNVIISGFYCCDSTSNLFGEMRVLAMRFGISQTGFASGDGNSVSGSQTGFTDAQYLANWPQNTTLSYVFNEFPPDPGGGGGSCFLASAQVLMADGSQKSISEVQVGDQVQGGFGTTNTVIAYHKTKLGNQPVYTINNKHVTTQEHRHFCVEGWAAINTVSAAPEYVHEIHVDNQGTTEKRKNKKFTHTHVLPLKTQMHMHTVNGPELIHTIEPSYLDPDQYVYTLVCDGSHTHVCDDMIVSAWARDDDWDYVNWKPHTQDAS